MKECIKPQTSYAKVSLILVCVSLERILSQATQSPVPSPVLPFDRFFNVSSPHKRKVYGKYGKYGKFSCKTYVEERCCSCADNCLIYGTCCIDKYWRPGYHSDIDTYISSLKKKFEMSDMNLECVDPFPFMRSQGYITQRFMMISSCPVRYSSGRTTCTQIDDRLLKPPVLGDDGFLYKNALCARCNFVSGFKRVNYRVGCDSHHVLEKIMKKRHLSLPDLTNCSFELKLPRTAHVPLCSWKDRCETKTKLQDQHRKSKDLCRIYSAEIKGYKNYHCAICNSAEVHYIQPACSFTKVTKPTSWDYATRWSVLMKFFHTATGSEFHLYKDNNIKEKYDRISTSTCTDKLFNPNVIPTQCSSFCPSGYFRLKSRCEKSDSAFHRPYSPPVHECFYANARSVLLVQRKLSNLSLIRRTIKDRLNCSISDVLELDNKTVVRVDGDVAKVLQKLGQMFKSIKLLLDNFVEIVVSPFSPDIPLEVQQVTKWSNQILFPGGRICKDVYPIDSNNITVLLSCDILVQEQTISHSNFSYTVYIKKQSTSLRIKGCREFYHKSSCIHPDLIPHYQRKFIRKQEYVFCDANGRDELLWTRVVEKIDGYVSFIGAVINVVCYTALLITLRLIPEALPFGLVCLSVSFLLFDSLYVIISGLHATKTTVNNELCKCLAIASHFSVVLVQSCSVLSAADLATKFGVLQPTRHRGTLAKYLRKRTPVLLTLSLVLVLFALTLDTLDIVKMGYGEQEVCFFHGYIGRLLFYVIPNSVSMIDTFLLVIFTLHKIKKKNRQSKRAFKQHRISNQPTRSITKIALKLILVYGVGEILAFVQLPNKGDVADIVNTTFALGYNVLRGLRGVIIFVVFICKPHVCGLYREKIQFWWTKKQKKATNEIPSHGKQESKTSNGSEKVVSKDATLDGIELCNLDNSTAEKSTDKISNENRITSKENLSCSKKDPAEPLEQFVIPTINIVKFHSATSDEYDEQTDLHDAQINHCYKTDAGTSRSAYSLDGKSLNVSEDDICETGVCVIIGHSEATSASKSLASALEITQPIIKTEKREERDHHHYNHHHDHHHHHIHHHDNDAKEDKKKHNKENSNEEKEEETESSEKKKEDEEEKQDEEQLADQKENCDEIHTTL